MAKKTETGPAAPVGEAPDYDWYYPVGEQIVADYINGQSLQANGCCWGLMFNALFAGLAVSEAFVVENVPYFSLGFWSLCLPINILFGLQIYYGQVRSPRHQRIIENALNSAVPRLPKLRRHLLAGTEDQIMFDEIVADLDQLTEPRD